MKNNISSKLPKHILIKKLIQKYRQRYKKI